MANSFWIRESTFPSFVTSAQLLVKGHSTSISEYFLSPSICSNSKTLRRASSTQNYFYRTRYCLQGLPYSYFIFVSSTILSFQICCSNMIVNRDDSRGLDRSPRNSAISPSIVFPSKPVKCEELNRYARIWKVRSCWCLTRSSSRFSYSNREVTICGDDWYEA